MKLHLSLLFSLLFTVHIVNAADSTDTIVLDETGVKNLRIETATAEEADFETTAFALAVTEAMPEKRSTLSSRIPGRVAETHLKVGTFVTKGEKLALIESRQPGDPPPTVWLTAPADGTVLSVGTVLGSPVEPSDTLADIADLGTIFVVATVPQAIAAKVKQGTQARIRFPIRPDKEYMATLLKFAACACPDPACALGQDVSTRSNDKETADRTSAGVLFTLKNPDNSLRPGMNAEVQIILDQRKNVLSIPRAALQGEASKRFVYVKHFDLPNAFIRTPVQTGEMNDRFVEIVSGLFPADEVVTRGAYSLSFAGGGSVSLKEALDAAHGHEHAADGSEPIEGVTANKPTGETDAHDDSHKEASPVWKYVSGVLLLLLIASFFTKLRPASQDDEAGSAANSNPKGH
jgi:multidrug efflux pump subunit AcrA (membrane-fusion protein)